MNLSIAVKDALTEAVKIATFVAAPLALLAALLSNKAFHVPAPDVVIVAAVSGAVAGFLNWAKAHGFVNAVVRALGR